MPRIVRAVPALLFTLYCASPAAAAEAETTPPAPPTSAVGAFPRTALQVGMGPSAVASTWRGDIAAGGSFRLGLLVLGVLAPDIVTRLAYSTVDDRMLTYLSLGVTGYVPLRIVRPYARLAFAHQHEESRAAIDDQPGNAVLGVGPGIRHRGGFAGAVGAEVPLGRKGRSVFSIGGDVNATHFPDPRGPATYFGGTLWAALHHGL